MWKKKQNKTKYHAKFLCPVKPGGLNVMMTFKFNFFLLRLPENFLWFTSFTSYVSKFVNFYASRLILFRRCTANG